MAGSVVLTEKRIDEAFEFKNSSNEFWLGLGQYTAWSDEDNPPDPTGDETEVNQLFGLIESSVNIDVLEASTTIGDSSEGLVDINADNIGNEANSWTVEIVNPGTISNSLNATWDEVNEILSISLETDSNGDLNSSINTAQNISDEINTLSDFNASVNTSGVFTQLSVDGGPYSFSEGEGPEKECCFCVIDESNGTVSYRGKTYRKVYDKDAYSKKATYLYFKVLIPVDEFKSYDAYRQIGLYRNLSRDLNETTSDDEYLDYPSEVSDIGELYSISNRMRIIRQEDKFETVGLILEF